MIKVAIMLQSLGNTGPIIVAQNIVNELKDCVYFEEIKELIDFSAKKMTIEYENLYSDLISSHPTK